MRFFWLTFLFWAKPFEEFDKPLLEFFRTPTPKKFLWVFALLSTRTAPPIFRFLGGRSLCGKCEMEDGGWKMGDDGSVIH